MSPAMAKPMNARRRTTAVPGFPSPTVAADTQQAARASTKAITATETASASDARGIEDRGGERAAVVETLASDPPEPSPAAPRRSAAAPAERAVRRGGGEVSKPGGHRHITNFRLYESEITWLKRQQRELEDAGVKTDVTELVHALTYAARRGELDPLEMLRRWRTDLNEI